MPSQINASNSGFGGIVSTGDSSGVLELQTTGTTAVTIDTSQRVGFVAGTAASPAITRTGDTNTGMFFPAADTIAFSEGGVEAMRLDSSGNVGIGTSSPAGKLNVGGGRSFFGANSETYSIGVGYTQARVNSGQTYYIGATDSSTPDLLFSNAAGTERMRITSGGALLLSSNPSQLWFGDTSTGSFLQGTNTGGYLVFGTGGTEYMRLSGNNLCIRQTSNSGGEVLGINGNGDTQIGLYCTPTSLYTQINFRNGNGVVGTVRTTGTSTQFNTSSDYRLKENVQPMTGALDKVMQLNPVTFTWKTDGADGQGFIAHELQAIIPDAVGGEKDAVDKNGNPDYQGVDASFLVATLTAAIQEQQTIINDLKARIETLEAK